MRTCDAQVVRTTARLAILACGLACVLETPLARADDRGCTAGWVVASGHVGPLGKNAKLDLASLRRVLPGCRVIKQADTLFEVMFGERLILKILGRDGGIVVDVRDRKRKRRGQKTPP